ncbi:MAG: transposase family protein [Bryobacteraceae bacterium]
MQDRELYRCILGIEAPWYVDSVELKLEEGVVHVRLAHHDMIDWSCPECGDPCKLHDHQQERRWRHLDTCQYHRIWVKQWIGYAGRKTKLCEPLEMTG